MRVDTMNNYIPYIKNDGKTLGKYYLVIRVRLDNIPNSWTSDFYKSVGDNTTCK